MERLNVSLIGIKIATKFMGCTKRMNENFLDDVSDALPSISNLSMFAALQVVGYFFSMC